MTDKISKELAKFTDKERQLVKSILLQLRSGELAGLQIVKLRGHDDIFRVKKGRIRIIYQQSKSIKVLVIERRS